MMENPLFPLNSINTTWVNPRFTTWAMDMILAFVVGLGIYLLLFPHLQGNPSFPPPRKKEKLWKHVKVKKVLYKCRKKSGTLKGNTLPFYPRDGILSPFSKSSEPCSRGSWLQRPEREDVGLGNRRMNLMEIQNLILLLQSLLGKLWDKDSSPLLVNEDVASEVFIQEPAGVQELPHQHLEDPSNIIPSLGSLAPLTKHTLPWASSLSEEHEDKSDLNRNTLDIVPQSSLVGHSYWASLITTISGLDCVSYSILFLSWWWATAKLLFFSTWVYGKSKQEHIFHHPSDPTISVDPTRWQVESGGLSFINSDVQTLLEMPITKRAELKVWKENIKNGSSFKQMSPDYTMYSLGNMLELMGSKRDTTAQIFGNTKDKPEQLHDSQDFSYHKDLGSTLEKKYSQLFWGLPSLHSESLVATAWVSKRSSTAQCKHVAFNIVSESLSVQHQDEETAQISQEELFSQEEAQSQLLAQNLSPSVAQGQTLFSTSYTFPNLPPSSSQIQPGTTTCSKSEKKEQTFFPTEEQHSECPLQNQREILFSEIQKTLEDLYQPALNLPRGRWASQISNSVSIAAGDSASQELENRLEQHIQEKLISDQPQLGPHCRFLESQEQIEPQDQYPGKSQCHKNDDSGPSQSSQSALTDNDLQNMEQPSQSTLAGHDLKKMETKHTERLSTMGSVTFKLDFPNKDLEPELQKQSVDISWSSGSTLGKIQNDNKEVSESYLRRNRKGIPESDLSTGLDKKIVEKVLQDHLSRKSVQIKEGMIPVCVRGSWLAANYAFPKSYMHRKPIYLASSKYQQSYVNTVQQLSFLDPGTHLKLETDIMRSRVRRRWSPSLQAFDPLNYTLSEAQTSPLPQPAFSSSAYSDYRAISIAKIGSLLEELPQKGQRKRVIRKILFPTLHNPLPALSHSEAQKTLQGTPMGGRHMTSNAYMSSDTYSHLDMNQQSTVFRGIGKASLEPSLSLDMASYEPLKQSKDVASGDPYPGATMLEIKVGTQSSTATKTKETELEKKKSSEWEVTVEASVMANSQTINVNLKNVGSLGNMKSPSPSRISISQDPGDQNLNTKIGSGFQVKVEFESEEQHQDQFTGVQQDCLTNELSTTDISHSGVSLSNSKSFCRIHKSISQALCNAVMKAGSSQEQEESKVTNIEVPGKNDTEMICLNKSQESFGRSRPREEEGSSLECGLSPSDKVKDIDTTSTKSFSCFPEKEQNPPISYCNIKMKDFVQSFNNHQKGKGKENSLNKVNLLSATTHTQKSATSQIFKEIRVLEPQALMRVVGQTLMDKLILQRRSISTEIYGHKEEPQMLLGRQSCQPKGSSYPERRQMFIDIASGPQAKPKDHSPKNKWAEDNNWTCKPRNVEPPATPFQLRPIGVSTLSHHHYPTCFFQNGDVHGQPGLVYHEFPGEKTFRKK
uniref:spermatogenesis-associated protein 31E1-like isoform X1 n=1 Tax=Ictidomys tridecemlineatus TaxID=43179 RepID=UPI001A9F64A4|nr:spermatogenesis-associated protein 31E1-like isoform X1 [Ictidomys tridecemlineatus]